LSKKLDNAGESGNQANFPKRRDSPSKCGFSAIDHENVTEVEERKQ
jgi:hypothetical protein